MGKVSGVDKHRARMLKLAGPEFDNLVGRALFVGAQSIQVAAQLSITEGSVSGKNHVASLPGEPPNNDTGVLANNIEATQVEPLRSQVTSSAPYAVELELGTSKMAARPYMEPAAQRERPQIVENVVKAVNKVLGGASVR